MLFSAPLYYFMLDWYDCYLFINGNLPSLTFWLGIEQRSNRRQNLVPDEFGPRFAWHTYQKPAPEKRSLPTDIERVPWALYRSVLLARRALSRKVGPSALTDHWDSRCTVITLTNEANEADLQFCCYWRAATVAAQTAEELALFRYDDYRIISVAHDVIGVGVIVWWYGQKPTLWGLRGSELPTFCRNEKVLRSPPEKFECR